MSMSQEGFLASFQSKSVRVPDQIFARYDGEPISFGSLDAMSASLAASLRQMGLEKGDRVAVMMRNSRFSLAVLFGLARAGLVWVPVNAQQKGEGLRYILDHCEPGAVICDRDLLPVIEDCGIARPERLIVAGDATSVLPLETLLAGGRAFAEPAPAGDDLFAIMYTSGTTGRPKGVLVAHGMMRLAGEAVKRLTAVRKDDVFLVWEPLYHIGGAQLIILPILEDVSLAMVERFSASRFWGQVRTYGATHIHYLGGILQILLKQPETAGDRDHPVRVAWGGGCPKEVWPLFRDRFSVEMHECYGMTEASSITTCPMTFDST